MERELDTERKSNEAYDQLISDPGILNNDFEKQSNFNDVLLNNSLKLNYFYKTKFQEYLNNLK